ncbi:adenylate cyclase [Paenibacillus algorifonticola]|uniref:Adenylate cyclase n=1 Tax=Paenibacillus algorifonticola TaxID=684063 RepID=A0A1I2D7G0_9BACL|nr:adenylate/guanylate cyclase domain-containing protein [Paenibacillus algorifonticola]SFE76444.1 adenylate cyclase [Paenibacillus algorifonticola]
MKIKLKHVMAVLTALALLCLYRGTFSQAEFFFQDHVMQRESPVDTQIVIVAVDDQSLEDLGTWPWSRSAHAQLVDTLSEGKPEVIAFDVTFATSSDEESDSEFVDAVARAGNVVLPVYGTFSESARLGAIEAEELSEPFDGLKEAAAATGHINTITDSDRVVRKALYSFNKDGVQVNSFTWEIYKLYMQRLGKQADASKLPLDGFQRFPIAYTSSPNQYEAISYSAVLSGDVPADYFTNKIVLIGPYAVGFNDDYLTPMNDKQAMNGVEIHANILQQLMEQDFKRELDWKWNALVLLASVVLAYYLFRKLNMLLSFLSVAALIAVFIGGGRYLYGQGILLSLGYAVPLLAVSCLAVVIFNYVSELVERRRVTDIFGRYVAPQVVSQILKNGEDGLKLGGSRRVLTVLFVDIRGFTPLSEKAEPEEIVEILNEYLDLTASCIFEQEGTLDKFIGDATMAIFNAPLLLEDHPMKAVRAAWAMKQGSVELEKKLTERFGFGVKFGIGIHTGPAVFGNIGSKTRMDYTAIGDTVNTAARLESNAKPGQIVLSESTYEAVKDRILAESLGEIKVKGKEQGIHIYELEGLK